MRSLPLCPLQSDRGTGHGKILHGDDSSDDMKPFPSFRSHKKIKLSKHFSEGRMSMVDVGLGPIALTRKDTVGQNSSPYPSLPNVTITPRTTNDIGGNGSTQSSHSPHSGGMSVIQSLNGAHSQFYPQGTSYENLLHSPHHYANHANSPHILSY